jgi:hypothetical protein
MASMVHKNWRILEESGIEPVSSICPQTLTRKGFELLRWILSRFDGWAPDSCQGDQIASQLLPELPRKAPYALRCGAFCCRRHSKPHQCSESAPAKRYPFQARENANPARRAYRFAPRPQRPTTTQRSAWRRRGSPAARPIGTSRAHHRRCHHDESADPISGQAMPRIDHLYEADHDRHREQICPDTANTTHRRCARATTPPPRPPAPASRIRGSGSHRSGAARMGPLRRPPPAIAPPRPPAPSAPTHAMRPRNTRPELQHQRVRVERERNALTGQQMQREVSNRKAPTATRRRFVSHIATANTANTA